MTSTVLQNFLGGFKKSGLVNRILVTGGTGAFGRDIYPHLRQVYGADNVLVTDIENRVNIPSQHYRNLDVTNKNAVDELVLSFKADTIIHLASVTPIKAENDPKLALKVNTEGARNVIEIATTHTLRMFAASSVSTFGSLSDRRNVPDIAVQRPETMQGITKFYLELMGNYHRSRHSTDFRAIRYPLIVSPSLLPGRINTEIIEMYYAAAAKKKFKCHLRPKKLLPVMYIDDAIISLLQLLEAPKEKLSLNTYNATGCSITPEAQVNAIRKHYEGFNVKFEQDLQGELLESWPETYNDSGARDDWGFNPQFGVDEITAIMLQEAKKRSSEYKNFDKVSTSEKTTRAKVETIQA
jgi:threonine 3-dehydrogenase